MLLKHDNDSAALDAYLALIQQIQAYSPELVHLTTKEAAIFLRCSTKCLEARRVAGLPPQFKKSGGRVYYQLSELIASLEPRQNTCQWDGKI